MSKNTSNKRIAKNTLLLYIRMFLTMSVSLYTSRIVLNVLGIVDFGVYNIVGGVVMMFGFLSASMASATQRFLSFELGKNDQEQLKRVFSMSVNIHSIIAVLVFVLAETVGLWFFKTHLNIPLERMDAATWVYHFSVLSFMVTILSVPYNATIIAHEKMNVYAYVSILEVTLKLSIVFILSWLGYDKLKMYAVLVFTVSVIVWTLYWAYCKWSFIKSSYFFFWDQKLYKTLMSYAGWNLFGSIAGVAMAQGVNILLNMFFGPIVNAARGIAYQVNGAVNGFVGNFQIAMNPQIVKSYATNDDKYMHQLIFQGSKYSFFLLFLITLPILLETSTILKWWLVTVPPYTAIFCRLILINALVDCISGPLITAAQATGKIKVYQAIVGGLLLLILPVSYIFLKLGYSPEYTIYISIFISLLTLFSRLLILRKLINLPINNFMIEVLLILLIVTLVSIIVPLLILINIEQSFLRFMLVGITSVCFTAISIYIFGLKKEEKLFIGQFKTTFMNKIKVLVKI